MLGSTLVRDPKFQDRVVAETCALLTTKIAEEPQIYHGA
jgi:hypothetical protein